MRNEHPDPSLLDEYSLTTLPERDARRIRAHVERCAACRKDVEDREGLLGSLALGLPGAQPPVGLEEAIMQRIRTTPQEHGDTAASAARPRVIRGAFRSPALVAAAAVLIVALSGFAAPPRAKRHPGCP